MVVTIGQDSFFKIDEIKRYTELLKEPKRLEIVSDTDHFWWNREKLASHKVASFMAENL